MELPPVNYLKITFSWKYLRANNAQNLLLILFGKGGLTPIPHGDDCQHAIVYACWQSSPWGMGVKPPFPNKMGNRFCASFGRSA
jgi:hypothetical protein